MFSLKVSSRGQIKLPDEALKAIGVGPGDKVLIELRGDAVVIKRAPDFFELEGFLHGKGLPPEDERRRMAEGVAKHVLGKD